MTVERLTVETSHFSVSASLAAVGPRVEGVIEFDIASSAPRLVRSLRGETRFLLEQRPDATFLVRMVAAVGAQAVTVGGVVGHLPDLAGTELDVLFEEHDQVLLLRFVGQIVENHLVERAIRVDAELRNLRQ